MRFIGHVVRFVISALVLLVVSWIVPQFSVGGFWSALLLALVIAALGWVVESMFGKRVSPFGRGIVGFLISALVIWIAQFITPHVEVTVIGALLAALVVGIIDIFMPTPYDATQSNRNHR